MKIGLSYNLFDGEELLESSIFCIRNCVDYISVVYQKNSNYNSNCNPDLINILNNLRFSGLIDEIVEYKPDFQLLPWQNELKKRNIGLNLSKLNNCSHHLTFDTDEFFDNSQFTNMLDVVVSGDYDSSVCKTKIFYKSSKFQLDVDIDTQVPLLYKISEQSEFIHNHEFPVLVDPTRRMKPGKCKIFKPEEIIMYHMSYVRRDLEKKLINSSARVNFEDSIADVVEYYKNWKEGLPALMPGNPAHKIEIIKVDNKFGINF